MATAARIVATTAILSLGALALSGCAFLRPETRFSDASTVTEPVTEVEIDQPDGAVTVRGVAGATGISLERTVRQRGDREIGETHRVDGETLVLGGCGRNCTVDYVLEVPVGLDVSGETSNGSVTLEGVHDVEVTTSNGRIELDEVTGEVDVETDNGRITGRELGGDGIEARTSNGAIELALGVPQEVLAHTSNGSIDLEVPEASYHVDATTSNGSVDLGVASDPDGEFLLELRTSNGGITVSPAG